MCDHVTLRRTVTGTLQRFRRLFRIRRPRCQQSPSVYAGSLSASKLSNSHLFWHRVLNHSSRRIPVHLVSPAVEQNFQLFLVHAISRSCFPGLGGSSCLDETSRTTFRHFRPCATCCIAPKICSGALPAVSSHAPSARRIRPHIRINGRGRKDRFRSNRHATGPPPPLLL
jgi:hypothetical protein